MQKQQWKVYGIALAFVGFGFALGVSADRLYLYRKNVKYRQVAKELQKDIPTLKNLVHFFGLHLKLSPKQLKKFSDLVEVNIQEGVRLIRTPQVMAFLQKGQRIRRNFRFSVRRMLNAKQKKRFNRMLAEIDRHRISTQLRRYMLHMQSAKQRK